MSQKLEKRFKNLRKKIIRFPYYLKDWVFTFKAGVTFFCLFILFTFPLLSQNVFYLEILILTMIYAIFAASWDFLAGFTGQVSFGHAIFLGLSAYGVSSMLVFNNSSWWEALIVGVLIAVGFGFIVGIICLRLKGPYLALGTMTMGIMLMNLFKMSKFKKVLHGDEGIYNVPALSPNSVVVFYTVLVFMILSFIIMIQITKSNTGTILKSIRDDETGAEASGINTTKYKVVAFMISSLFAGLAGGLYVMYNRSVNPLIFQPLFSFIVLVMAAMGGIATISGSALGAFVYILLSEFLKGLEFKGDVNPIIAALIEPTFLFSILLILIIRFASEGILTAALERLKSVWDIILGR